MAYKRAKIRSSVCIPRYCRTFVSCEKGQVRLQLFVERTGYLTWELEAESTSDRQRSARIGAKSGRQQIVSKTTGK